MAAVLLFRCSEFVSSRALRAQKCCKKFSKNSEKFAKMHQIPPSAGEPGGASLILGPPWCIVLRKGPHIIDSLKSKNFSNFFLKNVKNQNFFSREFENFRRRAAIITLPNIWKKNLWKFLKKFLKNSKFAKKFAKNFASLAKCYKLFANLANSTNFLQIFAGLVLGCIDADFWK